MPVPEITEPPPDDVEALPPEETPAFAPGGEPAPSQVSELEDADVSMFDVPIELSEEDEKKIVSYLEDNLPKMKPPDEEQAMCRNFLAMYEMKARKRGFPYENAPSLASSDAHDAMNEWLDVAETAFFMQRTTFTVDREETVFSEDVLARMEKTYHRRFFLKSAADDLKLALFEAGFLGAAVVGVRESFDIQPVREKIVIRNFDDLTRHGSVLTTKQAESARKKVSEGELFVAERESLKIINIGPSLARIDLTKFWYPRNTKLMKEWDLVSEQEFYTKSAMLEMAERGEFKKSAVDQAISTRKALYSNAIRNEEKDEDSPLPQDVRSNDALDAGWIAEMNQIKELGDAYEDQFAVYRVTLKYNLTTKVDPSGRLRSWIQVLYCPSGRCLLGSKFCQDGFPYYLIQRRPVPYKAMGPGIANERYNHNLLDTDLKSLFLASIEQEVGAPLLIRKSSDLWASGFRAYPGSVAYTDNPDQDVKFASFPEKSRLAAQGMTMVLGSSPMSNKGAGYASGKREEELWNQKMLAWKARVLSVALDFDKPVNAAWKIFCRLAKYNRESRKIVEWVCPSDPGDTKLFVLESEMDPKIQWTSVVTAISLTPDARKQEAIEKFIFFHKDEPASVNNPQKTVAWQEYMADYFGIDQALRAKLLLTVEDVAQFHQQLGVEGAQGGDQQRKPSTALQSQSPGTPFSRPPRAGAQQQAAGALRPTNGQR